jgi:hypothetical protein
MPQLEICFDRDDAPKRKGRLSKANVLPVNPGDITTPPLPATDAKPVPAHTKKEHAAIKKGFVDMMRQRGMKMKDARRVRDDLAGGGFFDTMLNVVKKGYDFYNKNKDTIHEGVKQVIKHAPTAISVAKSILGKGKSGGAKSGGGKSGGCKKGGAKSGGDEEGGKKPRKKPVYSAATIARRKKRGAEMSALMKQGKTFGEASKLLKGKGW